MTAEAKAAPPPCARCKEQDGVLDLRSEAICETCFTAFVASKAIKRLEVLQRETRAGGGSRLASASASRPQQQQQQQQQRYLLALSRGPSSTALLHILDENVRMQRERHGRMKFELVPVFVDVDIDIDIDVADQRETTASDPVPATPSDRSANTAASLSPPSSPSSPSSSSSPNPPPSTGPSPSNEPTQPPDQFKSHFPNLTIHTIPLSSILSSPRIAWCALPAQDPSQRPPRRLATLFSHLPSASARADVSRLLTRHALLAAAAAHDCDVVLLGYNTTSLAELTLAEAAKGRGFGIPWLVNDGAFTLPPPPRSVDPPPPPPPDLAPSSSPSQAAGGAGTIPIYSPLREIFRKEILTYLTLTRTAAGPLTDLFPSPSSSSSSSLSSPPPTPAAVISHRDLSLDDVVARYFADVEASYPSVVANVVRTTGKLNRSAAAAVQVQVDSDVIGRQCGLCSGRLDPLGDERWKGEIGEADANGNVGAGEKSRLCYGCERSVKG
ncbi:hypothetical protein F4859DRAFT_71039 [Xylaria cf. heliscus]|nr:hypothetical protein F4859DRAFT_71039 [Xylaria cf. heliscus]